MSTAKSFRYQEKPKKGGSKDLKKEESADNFMVVDGEILFYSSKPTYPTLDKKTVKSKSGEGVN